MRVMGLDVGERRIGVAVSDPTATIATPLETLRRRAGKRPPFAALSELARAHEVEALVVGLPLSPAGDETDWCREVRALGDGLAERLGVPVHYVDERYTSVQAERAVRGSGLPRHKREDKARVDRAAAVLILQSWLDRREGA
ncbi:MAG: Holliday junction resolvase RuvX [Gemmatimonadetes bacterium]|nr:MAG: Holliday junction resolvase RuvX [Gemmatimonadota bacterium]